MFFPAFDWAISPTHPEREERLLYTRDQLFEEGLMDLDCIREYRPRMAEAIDIARVHFCVPGIPDQVTEAHLIAAGGALVLADALMQGEIDNGFALIRPPGHHAMRVVHGNRGFCNINNEAVMIEYLRRHYGIRRIAVVDTDVHHGDGTQDIFYHDPDVLFISFHQDGRTLYPGTGFVDELGGPGAMGLNLNLPLPPGTDDEGIHYVLDNLVLPVIKDFQPDLVLNSSGQDNHYTDPLANMHFSARGYAWLTEKLRPDLAVLEGGYAIETALPYINVGIILALAGLDYSWVREPDYQPAALRSDQGIRRYLRELVRRQQEAWEQWQELRERRKTGRPAGQGLRLVEPYGRQPGRLLAIDRRGQVFQRDKQIYYDTDNIREIQEETIYLCPDCSGWLTIDSRARYGVGGGNHIFAVALPWSACPDCLREGEDRYRKAIATGQYDHIYLQDRDGDRYRHYDCRKRQETVIEPEGNSRTPKR